MAKCQHFHPNFPVSGFLFAIVVLSQSLVTNSSSSLFFYEQPSSGLTGWAPWACCPIPTIPIVCHPDYFVSFSPMILRLFKTAKAYYVHTSLYILSPYCLFYVLFFSWYLTKQMDLQILNCKIIGYNWKQ